MKGSTMKLLHLILSGVLLVILAFPHEAAAKRIIPQAKSSSSIKNRAPTRGVSTSVKFRGDRRAIVVNFSNLSLASSVSYTLSYTSRGTPQGAGGTISPAVTSDPTSREIIFGSCSSGVCRYDSGITNAKFVVTTTLKNGGKVVKSFKLKV